MKLAFSFLILLGVSVGVASPARALIIGGVDMTSHDPIQRSTAAMYSPSANGPGGALCTASLIGKNMAVTAAHCVKPGGYAPVMIFGPNVRSPDSVQRPITGEVVNPAWGSKAGHGMDQGDIAVVKFGGGLPPGYRAAALDSNDTQIKKGEAAILAGYGVSNASTKEGAGVLRKTTVAVANARRGKSEMILDQTHGRGACHGDSGGPAYFQRGKKIVLGGVTNRSYPDSAVDDCAHKVVYTKVAAYRPWIQSSEDELNRQRTGVAPATAQPDVPVRSMSKRMALRKKPLKVRAHSPKASSAKSRIPRILRKATKGHARIARRS